MYKELTKKEIQDFIDKYFPTWGKDIYKSTSISYNDKIEYLINEHYIFTI